MKTDIGYFIDIERLIRWTFDNDALFGDGPEYIAGDSFLKNWRRYEDFPRDDSIELINANLKKDELSFQKINIAQLMICINNAKDHNRGKEANLCPITSTGKKVITMLLLGRLLDGKNKNGFFTATKEKDVDVYEYLSQTAKFPNKKTIAYYYFPGRTVSFNQLCELSKSYQNGITSKGIYRGLLRLMDIGLVECVDKDKDLYKLSFAGCEKFLEKNK